MNYRIFFPIIVAVAAMLPMSAAVKTVTPERALAAARAQMFGSSMKGVPAIAAKSTPMRLAYTAADDTGVTAYIFTPEGEDAAGFIVASANDNSVYPLLGYSTEDSFDASNIPPQMLWWLSAIDIDEGDGSGEDIVIDPNDDVDYHPAVGMICKTKWNQSSPYNDHCPVINGERSVTGCTATAVAQIMKVHTWPERGTGSHTYKYTTNGRTYSESFNFEETTFDWASMRDVYKLSYSQASADAVATLMHACGVASEMSYSPEGSGAYEYNAAGGMIDFLGYDAAITVEQRGWHTTADWDNMIYNEVAAGRPILYCGYNETAGHAFVCDGYDGNGLYHINWGWGGVSNGYFRISNLNPDEQGIGGGGSGGFNQGQTATIGIQKAREGSVRPMVIAVYWTLDVDKKSCAVGDYLTFSSPYGFYNYSTSTLNDIYVGIAIENATESKFIGAYYVDELPIMYGIPDLPINTAEIPEGTWRAYPAVTKDFVTWEPMRFNRTVTTGNYNITVDGESVTVSKGAAGIEAIEADRPASENGTLYDLNGRPVLTPRPGQIYINPASAQKIRL